MLFRDSLSSLLPSPRDDEPASLRQDIVDELSDHLACAYNRELLRGTNADLAHQRVLNRFGNPAALARRLWLDAMKGKIMAKRVLIATCLVVMLACGTSVGLAWNWMNQDRLMRNREAAEASEVNRRLAEALAQAQTANKDMLNKLGEMSEAIRHPVSLDWNPVTFKLTEESASGRPAAGVSLALTRMEGTTPMVVNRTSDASGVADFGAIRPGDYTYRLIRNWPNGNFLADGEFNLRPGTEVHKSIVCPKVPPETVPVQIKCVWPPDLETAGLFLYAPFTFVNRSFDREFPWTWNEIVNDKMPEALASSPQLLPVTRSILRGTIGTNSFEIVDLAGLHLWKAPKAQEVFGDILDRDLREQVAGDEELKWEPGTYCFPELMVVRPHRGQDVEKGRRRFDVLASICSPGFNHTCQIESEPPHSGLIGMPYSQVSGSGYAAWPHAPQIPTPLPFWSSFADKFEARPGQVNEWTISLPDELIKAVRAALKPDPSAEAKLAGPAAPAQEK
jgi:hypothetical protein